MTKFKIIIVAVLAVASAAAILVMHRRAQVQLCANDAVMRQQDQQLTELTAQQQRLAGLVAEAKGATNSQSNELANLWQQVQALQKQTNTLGMQFKSNRQARASRPAAEAETHPPEYYDDLHRLAAAKPRDARNLSTVFAMYASDHQGRFPASFEQVADYLRQQKMPLSGTNEFDIVYRGSRDALKDIPGGAVAILRDRQTWVAPSGKTARVYGMADGTSLIVEADDNFAAWEAEHIFAPKPAGQ
jgi:hypothetical protein